MNKIRKKHINKHYCKISAESPERYTRTLTELARKINYTHSEEWIAAAGEGRTVNRDWFNNATNKHRGNLAVIKYCWF